MGLPCSLFRWLLMLASTASMAWAAEWRVAGVLGNSGGDGSTLVTIGGNPASGIGPMLDDARTLWERGGSKQLNRYSLDGRLLSSFELPESADRNDQMTRVGGLLLLKLHTGLYTLSFDAGPGTKPRQLPGEANVISGNSRDGKIVVSHKETLFRLDAATGERTELFRPGAPIAALWEEPDGRILGFGSGKVFVWKDAAMVAGYPKSFIGDRPQKFGRFWYSHSWHGSIHRLNESFEPEPGVVLGGASGSFIGYIPASNELTFGSGLAELGDGLYVVSGVGGVIQFLRWNDGESRLEIVRRIGALAGVELLALDAAGQIWTPRGSWRWPDACETPATLGDGEPELSAQAVMLDGKTLSRFERHGSTAQLAHGGLIDANGLSHFANQQIDAFTPPQIVTGAAAFTVGKETRMIATSPDGKAFEFQLSADGGLASKPEPVGIPGLQRCTSLAWFGGKLLAADRGAVIAFQREGERGWKESARIAEYSGDAYIHSDGKRLAVSDTAGGALHFFHALDAKPESYAGLLSPMQIAVAGDRAVVYEAGKQRLVKLERQETAPSGPLIAARPAPPAKAKPAFHSDTDFQDLSRPGGIPFSVALTPSTTGIAISVRTAAAPVPQIELGIANEKSAYTLTNAGKKPLNGAFDFFLPGGDWSRLRLAATVKLPEQQERFGFTDRRAMHAPFDADPSSWAAFDLEAYRELVAARKLAMRLEFEQPHDGKATVVIENEAGERVRNLVSGRAFSAGRHTVAWDGTDDNGRLVAPGNYRWRGVTHEGIRPSYLMNFANGDEPTTAPWGPNHCTLQEAAANGDRVFFSAPVTEGGWALLSLDNQGKFRQGYTMPQGGGIGINAIAADAKYLYCAQDGIAWSGSPDLRKPNWKAAWKLTLSRFDIQTGALAEWPGKQRAIEVDAMEVGPQNDLMAFNLGGLALLDGRLYVGSRDKKAVFVLDAGTGAQLDKIPLEGSRHLAAGKEIFAATDRGVVRLRDEKLLVERAGIRGITVAPNGDVLISDSESHQVRRYSMAGKELEVIGAPGGPYRGAYDPQHMVNPAGLAFGPDGKLWVAEDRWNPKRVLAWDLAANKVVIEKFGMPHYGGDGAGFDPENPRRWIGLGCFWDIDLETHTARPTHILSLEAGRLGPYEPHSYSFFREAGRTFVCSRGKISLISEVLPDGTLHDLAATSNTHHFAYAFDWKPPQAFIDAFYTTWPEKRANETPAQRAEEKPWAKQGMGVLWVDRNGDGEMQKEEFDFCGDQLAYAGASWGHLQNSLTFYAPIADKRQAKIVSITPKGMLANGVPDYPTLEEALAQATPVSLAPGNKRNGVATVRDRFGRFLFNSDPEMNAYGADGSHLWSYPNQWTDVHGSHDAPLPEPGMMQGAMAFLGIAPLDETADVVFMNGNHGRCYLLSSDGLYLDEAFADVRVSYLNNEYRLGGEIFGGAFGRDAKSGKYLVQIGHGPYRIYELAGFDKIKRMSGMLTVTKEQIAAAERQNSRRIAQKQQAREATIPGSVFWDKSGKFKTQVEIAADESNLTLTWKVQDDSPWVNNGRDWTTLFATGDTVDFQFGSDLRADPKRHEPVAGDKRLLIAPHEGKPMAVLYEYRKRGGASGGNAVEFTSPWRGAKVDEVRRLPEAKIEAKVEGGSYTVKAVIPLESLGLALAPGEKLRADFGVTFGDAAGTDTNLRSYWSNQSTGLVDDIPGEVMVSPELWGEVVVDGR